MTSATLSATTVSATLPIETATALLADHIRLHGPIATARVSSAQAKGAAKKYSYWGAVRYEIRVGAAGHLTNAPLERASSDRRSERLAEQDCDDLCDREGRMHLQAIGRLSETTIRQLVAYLGLAG